MSTPTHPERIRELAQQRANKWEVKAEAWEREAEAKRIANDPAIRKRGQECQELAALAREEIRLCLVTATDHTDYTPESDKRLQVTEEVYARALFGPPPPTAMRFHYFLPAA